MSAKDKKEKAAANVAALQKVYDKAAAKVAGLSDNEKPEVVKAAGEAVAEALENLKKAKSEILVKVKFIKSPTARFGLGYSAGEKGEVSLLLAEAVQEEGYGHITTDVSKITANDDQTEAEEKAKAEAAAKEAEEKAKAEAAAKEAEEKAKAEAANKEVVGAENVSEETKQ